MAKTNSSFNLSKPVKRVMGTVLDKNIRAIYKKAMIDAEHSHLTNKNRRPRENTSEKREVSKD